MSRSTAGPLDGIRVLELCRVPPAELPGMMLADLGAEVTKIETPQPGAARDEEAERLQVHAHANRSKRSMALNLKHEEGRGVFLKLAREADVVIEGFRPGVLDRLGVGYRDISPTNPKLVFCAMSGFGQDGPMRDRPAHDLNFLALSGALSLWGGPGRPPDIPLNLVADLGGAAMHAAMAVIAALFARQASGVGQYIDISYLDSTVALLAATPNLRRLSSHGTVTAAGQGIFCGGYPYYALYRTADARWLSVACSEPPLWRNFCESIDLPDLARFARSAEHYARAPDREEQEAHGRVAARIEQRPLSHWVAHFEAHDVCVAPVLTVEEALATPQAVHRGLLRRVDDPRAGSGSVSQVRSALGLSGSGSVVRAASPILGEHTMAILRTLGIDDEGRDRLKHAGVIGGPT
jgi:alpha-methylacyl-CoA racemase